MRPFEPFFAVLMCCVLFLSFCTTKEEETGNDNGNGTGDDYKSVTVGDFTLEWKTDTLGMLHVKVRAPTTGWVAVGFDPTTGMQDANIIIGYVNNGVNIRDDFGIARDAHASDVSLGGEDNVTNKSGTETTDLTEIIIPLDSGDSRDRPLVEGNTYTVILAYGQDNAFDVYHDTARTSTNIEL